MSEAHNTSDEAGRPEALLQPLPDLPPADYCAPVFEAYKRDVDRTLLPDNIKLTVEERLRKAENFNRALEEMREAGRRAREREAGGGGGSESAG